MFFRTLVLLAFFEHDNSHFRGNGDVDALWLSGDERFPASRHPRLSQTFGSVEKNLNREGVKDVPVVMKWRFDMMIRVLVGSTSWTEGSSLTSGSVLLPQAARNTSL